MKEDGALVAMYENRDEAAIIETEQKYGAYCLSLARGIVSDEHEARACLNEALLRVWHSVPPQKPQSLRLYLARIVRNLAFNQYKASHSEKRGGYAAALPLDELAECIADDVGGGAGELTELLNSYLGSLDARRRQMFVCRYYYSDSVEDVARALSVSPSYVYRELAAIRAGLKVYLENRGYSV